MITNLAQFKRALTIGSVWQAYHYDHKHNKSDLGARPVSIKQSNAVAFKTKEDKDSWMHFSKAECYEFKDDKVFIYWPRCEFGNTPRQLVLEYSRVGE